MRPPTVARSSSAPHRGHRPPRRRWVDDVSGMHTTASEGSPRRRTQHPPQPRQLLGIEVARRALRGDARLPQRLVGEQVAHPGDDGLVEEPGLDRRRPAADPVAELSQRDPFGVRAQGLVVGVEPHPAEPPRVEQPQLPAVLEGQREPVPDGVLRVARGGAAPAGRQPVATVDDLGVRSRDDDVPAHPEVQGQLRPRGLRPVEARGVAPDRLALAVGLGQLAPEQRLADLARLVGPADVGVVVVDLDDAAVQPRPLDGRSGGLDLGQLGHRVSLSTPP